MSGNKRKIAVVLFNLGGPDSKEAIRPFLMNFFTDRNIIRLPFPLRYLLAKIIAFRRSKKEAGQSYGELGNCSPLLENSQAQARALEKTLNETGPEEFRTFVCMRYWHPMAPQVMRAVREYGPDHIVLLPLYPQFSTTTTRSSLEQWNRAMRMTDYSCPTGMVCCYPMNEGYIRASASNIRAVWEDAAKDGHENPRILFSAHGLPESVIRDGDPYQWQCEQSAEKIAEMLAADLNEPGLDWQICYQSRVGPKKWIGPGTEEALAQAAREGKAVIIYPHAFTQEHVETLVELDIEYKQAAEDMGLKGYYRARTVGTHSDFIKGLAEMVTAQADKTAVGTEGGACLCPPLFRRCCMRQFTTIQNREVA